MTDIQIPDFVPAVIPADEPAYNPDALHCDVCGVEIEYAGRGRKPTKCDEHKKNKSRSTGTAGKGTGNERLARQAAEALVQVNGLAAFGLYLTKMPNTSAAIRDGEEGFRQAAYEALVTDPELCRTILKGGIASGRVALILAYAMLGTVVVPVAMEEFKDRRAMIAEQKAIENADELSAV